MIEQWKKKIDYLLFRMPSKCGGLWMPILSVYFPISSVFQGGNIVMKYSAKDKSQTNNWKKSHHEYDKEIII